jgi:hypothetical protein
MMKGVNKLKSDVAALYERLNFLTIRHRKPFIERCYIIFSHLLPRGCSCFQAPTASMSFPWFSEMCLAPFAAGASPIMLHQQRLSTASPSISCFRRFWGLLEGEAVLSHPRNRIIAPSWQPSDIGAPNRRCTHLPLSCAIVELHSSDQICYYSSLF